MRYLLLPLLLVSLTVTSASRGAEEDAASADFAAKVDLAPLETLTVQHQQTLKTLDSYARQTISTITGKPARSTAAAPLFTVLDMRSAPKRTSSGTSSRSRPSRCGWTSGCCDSSTPGRRSGSSRRARSR